MNKRERFLAFAGFEAVDRVPRKAAYVAGMRRIMTDFLGDDPDRRFDMDSGCGTGLTPPPGYRPPDFSVYHPGHRHGEGGFTIDENGCGHLNHGFHHFTEYISPLRNATSFDAIERFPIPDNADWSDEAMTAACADGHARGFPAILFLGHIYESSWQVRGYEEFLMDLLMRPEWAVSILERFCRNRIRAARAAASVGYDCLCSGDDVANQNSMMFSPDLWRRVLKPCWTRVYAAAREIKPDIHIWYHSDGNITEILDDLVDIGVTILNPVQPECMDPLQIRRRYGKRLAFDGCIGTQTTFPFGTPAQMRQTVRDLSEALDARHGGLMLSPTHVLEPDVPPENVMAFFEACDSL